MHWANATYHHVFLPLFSVRNASRLYNSQNSLTLLPLHPCPFLQGLPMHIAQTTLFKSFFIIFYSFSLHTAPPLPVSIIAATKAPISI